MAKKKDPMKAAMSEYFAKLGSKGGKIGGKKRWAGKSDAERSAIMTAVTQARQAKREQRKRKIEKGARSRWKGSW